jgi:hypothetical protein
MSYLLTPLVDPRPLEPDWVYDAEIEELEIEWVATYLVWNRDTKSYDRPEDCGFNIHDLVQQLIVALKNQLTCTVSITIKSDGCFDLKQYVYQSIKQHKLPEITGSHWRVSVAGGIEIEEGIDNHDLLYLLRFLFEDPKQIPHDDWVIEISEYDPTP